MTVYFMGNRNQLPRGYVDRWVLFTFTGTEIVIERAGKEIGRFAYLPEARGMVRLTAAVFLDEEIHMSDTTRGRALDAARRQVEIYEEIVQGRRAGCR